MHKIHLSYLKPHIKFSGIITFLVVLLSPLFASQNDQANTGEVGASFLQINPSVRIAAMGGDQAAARHSLGSLYSNPASLTSLIVPELLITHNESLGESQYETVTFGLPMKETALAVSFQYINDGSFERVGIDSTGNPITGLGDGRFSNQVLLVSSAKTFLSNFSMGANFKGFRESHVDDSNMGVAGDLGLQMTSVVSNLDLGLVYRNVGPKVGGFPLARTLALGGAYHLNPLSLFSEIDITPHRDSALKIGLEYSHNAFWVRSGFQNLTGDLQESLTQFSFGGGLRIKGWKVDYAWLPRGDLGDEHRLGVSIGFGLTPEERRAEAKRLDHAMAIRIRNHSKMLFGDGQEAMTQKNYELASQKFRSAMEWDPENKAAKNLFIVAQEKYNAAEADYHYELGQEFSKNNQWVEAALQFEQALEFNPQHTNAKQNLNESKQMVKRFGQDIEKAKKIKFEKQDAPVNNRALSAPNVDKLSHQAYTLYTLGQTQEAIGLWKKILTLDPHNTDAKVALKNAEQKQEIVGTQPVSPTQQRVTELNAKAMSAYGDGHYKQAAKLWREANRLDPHNQWIKNYLSWVEGELMEGQTQ